MAVQIILAEMESTEHVRVTIKAIRLPDGYWVVEKPSANDLPDDFRQAIIEWLSKE